MKFTPPYSLSGEAGFPLAAQRMTLEQLGVDSATLTLRSMDADTLSWNQFVPAGQDRIVIQDGQEVSLFDGEMRRCFVGRAKVRGVWTGAGMVYEGTAQGPFEWLSKMEVFGPVADGEGNVSIRPLVVFPVQAIDLSIRQLLEMMQTAGMPMRTGRIDPAFPVVRMTFKKQTGEDALSDMLKFLRDATTRVRYDVDGLPEIDVIRRAGADVVTLELGSDPDRTTAIELEPDEDSRPTSVTVQAVERNAEGRPIFIERTAGPGDGPAFRQQRLVVSGPENNAILPQDVYENVELQTTFPITWAHVLSVEPSLVETNSNFGYFYPMGIPVDFPIPPASFTPQVPRLYNADGALLTGSWYRLLTGEVRDWTTKDHGVELVQGYIRGHFEYATTNSNLQADNPPLYELFTQGKVRRATLSGYLSPYRSYYLVDVPVTLVNASFPTLTTLWRKQDYDFMNPPADLAENLFAAQDFTPWKGSGRLDHRAATLPRPADLLNVTGAPSFLGWETARAAVRSLSLDLQTGNAKFQLGVPPRLDAPTLLDSFRRAADDNIEPSA